VPGSDALALRFGVSPWLRFAHFLVAMLGLAAILLTPAASGWKFCTVLALGISGFTAHLLSVRKSQTGLISLGADGAAQVASLHGTQSEARLEESSWVTRWFCVLALFEPVSRRRYHCVICASENTPDEYRRLLRFLNMRTSAVNLQKATWY
jgi:hypothetical protein